ncbi:MAG: pyruvate dehydrogenase (acetyl-transferring), homodimeric type [Acidobacteriota bacterium]
MASNPIFDPHPSDIDPTETREWVEAFSDVLERDGSGRAHYLLEALMERARQSGAKIPFSANTPYVNTIGVEEERQRPGDHDLERRIKSILRWNAMAMVVHANRDDLGLGGHIASYASSATLYEIGMNHFFHARSAEHGGDLVFMQGHSSPGIYARAFLEGRITEEQLKLFRREADHRGISSYPHPWLMPGFWQFPTVSMGLSPLMAIYQARFMKYLDARGLVKTAGRKVWAFLGDGEMDEPESLGAIALASREKLDNLIFVVNCNLQRLDGPVRGNGKIIQELEADFRGSGWNVIKVVWGGNWDPLLAKDKQGLLRRRMEEALDGDYQAYVADPTGKLVREHFFGRYPELAAMVSELSDADLWRLKRGGHDPQKVYAAYAAAVETTGQPTVILAKTVKGYGMGRAGEGQNITHQQKKMGEDSLRAFRDRFNIPISDERLAEVPFYRPPEHSPEIQYLKARRAELGGPFPIRSTAAASLPAPDIAIFQPLLEDSGERDLSTTMAFVRGLTALTKDAVFGPHIVPIVADEARTFGMEGMFRQLAIYAPQGQLYSPQDRGQLMYYREEKNGQILQEGINEAGGLASWMAAGTAYSVHGLPMVPFFIFYSMFGFQRVGDLIWAAGDIQARGFLIGATSGRTTLNGEGLQHQDGHSHLLSSTVPNCVSYDPTYAYELGVILHDGLRRMYQEQENVFFYITALNENYHHAALPAGATEGILKGLYRLREVNPTNLTAAPRVQLLGSGAILREVEAAAEILSTEFGVAAEVWSATSFNELRRDGLAAERWNRLHPTDTPRESWVERSLAGHAGPVIAATDYMKTFAEQIRPFVKEPYYVLGTDGFGRSDTRAALRDFFEVDRRWVAITALKALADQGTVSATSVNEAIKRFGIDPEKPEPVTV